MFHSAPVVSDFNTAHTPSEVQGNHSTPWEISQLLSKAVHCIDRDEDAAMECIRLASALMKPSTSGQAGNTPNTKSGGLAPWQVNRLRQHIDERISSTITLDEMAKLVKLSTSYFSAAFKVSFGISPHAYVLSRRVAFAKDRMANSAAPLCEIALDCGLSDQAHLSRVFRRLTGVTPSVWRRYRAHPSDGSPRNRSRDAAQGVSAL